MQVTLVYAYAPRQVLECVLHLDGGCTIEQAMRQAGWLEQYPEILAEPLALAVWGRKHSANSVLRDGDRVEVLRGLRVDPKVARRERFVGQGARSAGLFSKKRPGAKSGY